MNKTEERQFAAGQMIFREGDAAGGEAFVIHSGTVAIRKQVHGQARTIRTIGRGRIFGEIALFSKAPRSADAVAGEDTRVFVIPAERLEYLVKTYPRVRAGPDPRPRNLRPGRGGTPDVGPRHGATSLPPLPALLRPGALLGRHLLVTIAALPRLQPSPVRR